MTPAQQAALEVLAGRALTGEEAAALEAPLAIRNDVEIARLLPARPVVRARPIGIGTILAVLKPSGGDFLNALEAMASANANVKWILKLIDRGAFDIGDPDAREQMAAFAGAVPAMAGQIALLLAAAEGVEPIHYNAVSDALNIAEGRLTL